MKLHNKDTGEDGRLMMCHDYDEFPFFIEIGSIKIYYHNFADMIEAGWDCVKIPAEPLIKDEKIRKAVRAWAEAIENGGHPVKCYGCGTWIGLWYERSSYMNEVSKLEIDTSNSDNDLELDGYYTIAELCGEEE